MNDALSDKVRKAVSDCDREHWATIDGKPTPWSIIRAELLRLAVRNAELEAKATRDYEWVSDLLSENKEAEAELAALKARISGSVELRVGDPAWSDGTLADMEGKRVRLVVEE